MELSARDWATIALASEGRDQSQHRRALAPATGDRTRPKPVDERPHVVIVGGGFAGIACARALGNQDVRVTLVDRNNYHLFVPLLYQVATAALSPADIAEPIRKLLRHFDNIDVIMDEVVGVDAVAKRITLGRGGPLPYDKLVLATGSAYNYFGHEEWSRHAPGLKSIADARAIRARLLNGFEQAETISNPIRQNELMTTVIVGGGPTGVELAGAIAELARWSLARDFRNIDPTTATVHLIEAGPRILPAFPENLSAYAHERLQALGVTVHTGAPVADVQAGRVTVAGKVIAAHSIIWAAGIAASSAANWFGMPTDRLGRIPVEANLEVTGLSHVFALGDTALVMQDGKPLPALAQVAAQQGRYLGKALVKLLVRGAAMPPFRFRDRGNTAIIGRNAAIFDFGKRQLKGWFGWLLWAVVHVYLLANFEKRVLVAVQWLWRWFTYEREARLIATEAPPSDRPEAPRGRPSPATARP